MRKQLTNEAEVDQFVELIARAKAAWTDAQLRDIAYKATSPTGAYKAALKATGEASKALAVRWLAIAVRDYPRPFTEAIVRWVRVVGKNDTAGLKERVMQNFDL
jgi:hypothetical protein